MKKILDLNLSKKQYTIDVNKIIYLSPIVDNGVSCWFFIYFNHQNVQIMEHSSKEHELINLRDSLKRIWSGVLNTEALTL